MHRVTSTVSTKYHIAKGDEDVKEGFIVVNRYSMTLNDNTAMSEYLGVSSFIRLDSQGSVFVNHLEKCVALPRVGMFGSGIVFIEESSVKQAMSAFERTAARTDDLRVIGWRPLAIHRDKGQFNKCCIHAYQVYVTKERYYRGLDASLALLKQRVVDGLYKQGPIHLVSLGTTFIEYPRTFKTNKLMKYFNTIKPVFHKHSVLVLAEWTLRTDPTWMCINVPVNDIDQINVHESKFLWESNDLKKLNAPFTPTNSAQ